MKWYALAVLVGAVTVYLWAHQMASKPAKPASPTLDYVWLSPREVCLQLVSSPDTFACPDRHGWQDIGPVTPVPAVPR